MRQNINTFLQTTYNLVSSKFRDCLDKSFSAQINLCSAQINSCSAQVNLCSARIIFVGQPAPVIPAGINLLVCYLFFDMVCTSISAVDYGHIEFHIYIYTHLESTTTYFKIQDERVFRWFFNKNEFSLCWGNLVQATAKLATTCGKFVNSENLDCQTQLKMTHQR